MDIKNDLTKRQKEIFDFIRGYASKHGYPPTVREIGKAVGLTSSSTVHAHLANLEKIGLLKRDPDEAARDRGPDRQGPQGDGGRASPSSVRSPPAHRSWPRRTSRSTSRCRTSIGGEDSDYVLRVRGDSMQDAGILEGDYVVVKSADKADNGEIVVALLGEEATVKRFFQEKDRVRLQPENKAYKPIRTKEAQLLGRVVGVFRKVA